MSMIEPTQLNLFDALDTPPPMKRDELQQQAIALCCSTDSKSRIVAVTGQAGTGKTSIMKEVYDAFVAGGHDVALAAPTGKAAKRIAEATGIAATTIHRLLEFTHPGDPDEKTGKPIGVSVPRRKPGNPLAESVILVDEYSMVNQQLHRDLCDAMPPGCVLRVFGDVNQLPPIEEDKQKNKEPSAFEVLLQQFQSVHLKTIYRQGEGSTVVSQAHRILNGWIPQQTKDFVLRFPVGMIGRDGYKSIKDIVTDLVMEGEYAFHTLDDQIITPTNRGWIGTHSLNQHIQSLVHDGKMERAYPMPRNKWDKVDLMLTVGDKVLWSQNDYQLNVFNGEVGIVTDIGSEFVQVDFGDRTVDIPSMVIYVAPDGTEKYYDPRRSLQLAYVLTTHKCQGSEYRTVVYIMDKSAWMLQNRANFYTAVTRARSKAIVVSDQRSLQQAVVTKFRRF